MLFIQKKTTFTSLKSGIMHFNKLIKTIKNRRENLQVTQETLAKLSGVALRTIKQFESGKGNPTLRTLQKISNVLGLEVSLILKKTEIDETG